MIKEAQIQNMRTLQKKQDLDNQQVTKNGSASFRMKAHKMQNYFNKVGKMQVRKN